LSEVSCSRAKALNMENHIRPTPFPLVWPEDWPRTPDYKRARSRYELTLDGARRKLDEELRKFGAHNPVLSTNLTLRLDGQIRATQNEPQDPGVAVWWKERNGTMQVLACDKWRTVRENVRAVCMAVEAMRAINRCGASQILDRAKQSFTVKALGSGTPVRPSVEPRPWWYYRLKLSTWAPTYDQIKRAYRELAAEQHPDRGGNTEQFLELTTALRDAESWLRENGWAV